MHVLGLMQLFHRLKGAVSSSLELGIHRHFPQICLEIRVSTVHKCPRTSKIIFFTLEKISNMLLLISALEKQSITLPVSARNAWGAVVKSTAAEPGKEKKT